MQANALETVTMAIKERLVAAIGEDSDKVYVGPLDDSDAKGASLVLFLYRLVPNAELRNTGHSVPNSRPNDPATVYDTALPLDLYYVLTAGDSTSGGELPSLAKLGQAIQALNAQPNIVGSAVAGETVRLSLCSVSGEELSRIWQLFPQANYRTSVVYLASPVWIDPVEEPEQAPAVVQEPHKMGQRAA